MSFHSDHSDEESKWDYFRKLKQLDHDQVDENDERLRKYIHTIDDTQSSVFSDEMNAMERTLKLGSLRDQISDNIVDKIDDPKDRMLVGLLYKVCNEMDPTRMQFIKFSILLYEHGILTNLRFLLEDNETNHDADIPNIDAHTFNDFNANDGWSDTWDDDDDDDDAPNTDSSDHPTTIDLEAPPIAPTTTTIMSFKSFQPTRNGDENEHKHATIPLIPLTKPSASTTSITMNRYHREFEEIECIGFGAFGTVYKVKHNLDSSVYAIKKIIYKHDAHNHEEVKGEIVREVSNMAQLNHDNIVRYYTSWIEPVITTNKPTATRLQPSGAIPIIRKTPSNEELSLLLSSDATQSLMTPYASRHTSPSPHAHRWTDDIYHYWQNKMSYSCLFLQSEYCGDYTLKDFINDRNRSTPDRDDNMHLFAQILLGLAHCHGHKIIHRDLKPENIFLTSAHERNATCAQQLTAKIGDFGLSKSLSSDTVVDPVEMEYHEAMESGAGPRMTTATGTQTYAAPEQLSGDVYDVSADIYALGIILFELIQPPFDTQMERWKAISRFRKLHEIDSDRIDEVKCGKEIELLMKMTAANPRHRPSAYSLILDQFIQIYWMKNVLNGAIPAASHEHELNTRHPQRSLEYSAASGCEDDIRVSVVECKDNDALNVTDSPTFLISSPSTPPNTTLALEDEEDAGIDHSHRTLLHVMSPLSINHPSDSALNAI